MQSVLLKKGNNLMEITLTKENFENEVMKSDKPVLIDFWATWCGPCRMLGPVIEEIAKKYDGVIKVCKVNVDEEPSLANMFGVSSIPMVVLMKNGKVDKTSIGYKPIEAIEEMLK